MVEGLIFDGVTLGIIGTVDICICVVGDFGSWFFIPSSVFTAGCNEGCGSLLVDWLFGLVIVGSVATGGTGIGSVVFDFAVGIVTLSDDEVLLVAWGSGFAALISRMRTVGISRTGFFLASSFFLMKTCAIVGALILDFLNLIGVL